MAPAASFEQGQDRFFAWSIARVVVNHDRVLMPSHIEFLHYLRLQ